MVIPFPLPPPFLQSALALGVQDLDAHRRWGLRAFAMGIASFEYRVFLYAGDAWRESRATVKGESYGEVKPW